MILIPPITDEYGDQAAEINAAVSSPGRVVLDTGTHYVRSPVGINVTTDYSANLSLVGQSIRANPLITAVKDPAGTNKRGQHEVLRFKTTSGNFRFLHVADLACHDGSTNFYAERLCYSRVERIQLMEAWQWGMVLRNTGANHLHGLVFVHNVTGNSLLIEASISGLTNHLSGSIIGEDSGAIHVTSGGKLTISDCDLFGLRDNLYPTGYKPGTGNAAMTVSGDSFATVEGCNMGDLRTQCQVLFSLWRAGGFNLIDSNISVADKILLRCDEPHVANNGYGPVVIEGNTLWFGPNGKIAQAPFPDHYPRNSRIVGNRLMVPIGQKANFEAQLAYLRDLLPVTIRQGWTAHGPLTTLPNIVEGNQVIEY